MYDEEKANVLCNEKPRYANDKMPMRIFVLWKQRCSTRLCFDTKENEYGTGVVYCGPGDRQEGQNENKYKIK